MATAGHPPRRQPVSYFSRLTLIFSLLSSTENWASKEVSCGQTERSGQSWLL